MKTNLNTCPNCNGQLWGQLGNPKEREEKISYRICTTHNCNYRLKIKWDAEKQKAFILH